MNYDISLALRFSLRHSNRPLSADVGETSRLAKQTKMFGTPGSKRSADYGSGSR